jgi:hypothetical protein
MRPKWQEAEIFPQNKRAGAAIFHPIKSNNL